MTSFNINGPNKMPQVTEAQNMMNNGGGGNTGYLESRGKKKKKKEEEFDASILSDNGEDKFERSEVEFEEDDDYYGTKSVDETEKKDSGNKKDENRDETLNTDNLKDKFLGFVWKIANGEKPKETPETYTSGDFLTFSKKDIEK